MFDPIVIRECTTIAQFDACTRLQREAFGLPDLEISPRRHLVVTRKTGGWVLGAFSEEELVGFVLHLVAVRNRELIGYSHMMAIARSRQNQGIGARLKWAQRERALSEGVRLISWTWDPMQARNAHFNLNRLGAVARSFAANFYGTDYPEGSIESGFPGIDSDRLFADWELDAARPAKLARAAERSEITTRPAATIEIPADWHELAASNLPVARKEQLRVRTEFADAFSAGLICAGFERDSQRPQYLLFDPDDVDRSL